ncbi:hypothetical protein MtrunA17_Chr2g0288881 [Medicago truncatula]|uniref:RNase H type-1 domain-containing protein n=1 Tax=Medicago truncatula TaxID=3880 RepID=A0A396JBL7_MEDTR|nr:hypothetical protein MtrunA17_Chr2g0288881 [Medicago truncatula]
MLNLTIFHLTMTCCPCIETLFECHFANEIHSVPQLMATDWHVVVEHALRESNACADVLAKIEAWSKSPFVKISKPPIDLSSLLLDDAWGVGFVRN